MEAYSFKRYQPASLRVWHWLNALVIIGLLGTVLLRKTFLSWRTNAKLIEEKVVASGGIVTPEVTESIAKSMRDSMWDWHEYLGFVLGALLIGRVLIGIFSLKKCPATQVIESARGVPHLPAQKRIGAIHYTIVQTGYALFYLVTLYMVVSGIGLYFKDAMGLSKELAGLLKEVHEILMWFFVVFIVGHITGVIVAENRGDRGLISDMFSGGDKKE